MSVILNQSLVSAGGSGMGALLEAIPFSFMALFPVLNPLGSALIFLTMTLGTPDQTMAVLCRRIALNTFILLFVILLGGTYILRFFGITLPIVQVGGGIVVAYIGWRLLNQASDTTSGSQPATSDAIKKNILEMAFYPLTMPITAGPGCMAVTLTIGAHETISHNLRATLFGQIGACIGIILCALTVYYCYRYAERITHRFGNSGTRVIMRLSAFINFCIGLEISWHGVQALVGNFGA